MCREVTSGLQNGRRSALELPDTVAVHTTWSGGYAESRTTCIRMGLPKALLVRLDAVGTSEEGAELHQHQSRPAMPQSHCSSWTRSCGNASLQGRPTRTGSGWLMLQGGFVRERLAAASAMCEIAVHNREENRRPAGSLTSMARFDVGECRAVRFSAVRHHVMPCSINEGGPGARTRSKRSIWFPSG